MPPSLRRLICSLALAILATLAPIPAAHLGAHAQATWLDQPVPTNWNVVGMAIPAAPTGGFSGPGCGRDERPAEAAEDLAVAARGSPTSAWAPA